MIPKERWPSPAPRSPPAPGQASDPRDAVAQLDHLVVEAAIGEPAHSLGERVIVVEGALEQARRKLERV